MMEKILSYPNIYILVSAFFGLVSIIGLYLLCCLVRTQVKILEWLREVVFLNKCIDDKLPSDLEDLPTIYDHLKWIEGGKNESK